MKVKFLICLLLSLTSFALFAQRQGVKGQLFLVTGNQMPGPDKRHIPRQGVVREIYIYQLTNIAEADREEDFYKKIHTQFIKSVFSKSDGTFKAKLPPGTYSVFVKENKGLYANIFDSENNISPVTVEKNKYAWMTITINYEAAY